MSLDVTLYDNCCSACGRKDTVFTRSISHNLVPMAKEAGLYEPVWRPEDTGITTAHQAAAACRAGFGDLFSNPKKYRSFGSYDPDNGWEEYDAFVRFMSEYMSACARWPDALVEVWR